MIMGSTGQEFGEGIVKMDYICCRMSGALAEKAGKGGIS